MGWRLVVEKIPLVAVVAVNCKIVLSFHLPDVSGNPIDQISLAKRLANVVVSYAAYLSQSFYPVDMAAFYPLRTDLPIARVAAALVLLVAITAVAMFWWRRRPYVLVGWLWFLGMLVPVIGLVQIGDHARADRYTYLSQIGLFDCGGLGHVERLSVATIAPAERAGGNGCSRGHRQPLCCCLPRSPGFRLLTGRMPRRSGRMQSVAPSGIRWPTIIWPMSMPSKADTKKRSRNFAQRSRPIRSIRSGPPCAISRSRTV